MRYHWLLATLLLLSVSACSDSDTDGRNSAPDSPESTTSADTEAKDVDHSADDHDPDDHAHAAKAHGKSAHGKSHGHAATKRTDGLAIGEVVPDFEVLLDGKACKLSELQANTDLTADGTLALTFWCSFCHSCRDVEMDLNKLASELKGKAGVIAIDASVGETAEEIAEFKTSKGLTLPIAINADASVADLFGIKVTTTTVVIDSEGVLRYCGQFADRDHKYAADALAAVMAGTDVAIPESAHRG